MYEKVLENILNFCESDFRDSWNINLVKIDFLHYYQKQDALVGKISKHLMKLSPSLVSGTPFRAQAVNTNWYTCVGIM